MTLAARAHLFRNVVEISIFSAAANILLLVPALYLLQIYDRVIPAASMNTLVYLTIFAVGALIVLGLLDIVRSLYANRVAARLAVSFAPGAFLASLQGSRAALGDVQPLRDIATIRSFVTSRALFFLFDLPFGPLFLGLLYLIHPVLFFTTLAGVIVIVAIALLNQLATSKADRAAAESLAQANSSAQFFARNSETVRALGMTNSVVELWGDRYGDSLRAAGRVVRTGAILSGLSRTVRMILQIVILGVGGYLVLNQQITAGMIFAASLVAGRALQPLDQIVGSWQQIVEAGRAWKRVAALSRLEPEAPPADMTLPTPKGLLSLDQVIYFPPNADRLATPLIKRVGLALAAGESLALIGPSQAGKSTLARLMVGAIHPSSGAVRLDGAEIRNWDRDQFGRHVGYLSQEVELFPGTIAQNIARFDPAAADEQIIRAAQLAHVHDLILRQPRGYATEIGPLGIRLSGGERQRIALARAFYGDPKLLVLDEPNASLDAEGEAALEAAMKQAKAGMITVVIITHRPSIAAQCDRVLMLRNGQVEILGPAAEVLQRLQQGAAKMPPEGVGTPAVAGLGRGVAAGGFTAAARANS